MIYQDKGTINFVNSTESRTDSLVKPFPPLEGEMVQALEYQKIAAYLTPRVSRSGAEVVLNARLRLSVMNVVVLWRTQSCGEVWACWQGISVTLTLQLICTPGATSHLNIDRLIALWQRHFFKWHSRYACLPRVLRCDASDLDTYADRAKLYVEVCKMCILTMTFM